MSDTSEPLDVSASEGFTRLRGGVSYDGTNFSGWGIQPDRRTVQGDLEAAFATILRSDRMLVQCAGRTDAGVHATGQIFHIDVPHGVDAADLMYRVNLRLADDVVVTSLQVAPLGFDARFSALARSYNYLVNDGIRQPLRRHDVYQYGRAVDVDAMHNAAQQLLGLNDFSAFCKQKDNGTNIRELQRLDVDRMPDGMVRFHVTADAFCYSMVRMLVGALLDVGTGKRDAQWIGEYQKEALRDSGVTVAPANGLTLVNVIYPADSGMHERATTTRRTRVAGDPES